MIDYTLFVCLYFGITHVFLQLCKFLKIFLENKGGFCGSLTKFLKILNFILPHK